MTRGERRWGLFEAPPEPTTDGAFAVDRRWSARGLSGALIRRSLRWVVPGTLLLICFNIASMLLPSAIGGLVDVVVAPLVEGAAMSTLWGAVAVGFGVVIGLYLVMNLTFRFGGRIGWFAVQRSEFELTQTVMRRVMSERGMAGAARPPGRLLSIATADVHRACLVLYITVYPPGQVVALVVGAVTLAVIHPGLGLAAIVGLPLIIALMHLAARPLRARSMREQNTIADATAGATDLVAGYRVCEEFMPTRSRPSGTGTSAVRR